ncbi:MAG: hypothetical protein KBT13_06775 [Bacteroidales bacterium]|uniref:hypothetical protein n=1 Tax=Sodaliphilus sp. TaxID=2815818 RepID=UPI001B52FCBE|nr:hypothetical protein [Candidatus Sodaliphilus limicaballi]
MEQIDKIVFGDNQFFGINHRSQEKAEEMMKRFSKLQNILDVYDNAFECGVKAVMLNSNERAMDICDYFRENKSKYGDIAWYPSIPYPHKYANMVNELGIFPAINEVLFKNNSTMGVLSMLAKGASAAFGKDAIKMMEMLIDVEYKMFKGLNVKCLFLQNVITDLILGYDIPDFFQRYCEFIRKKYGILPGFITLNMPYLKAKLEEWDIEDVVICSSINAAGFNMHPSKEEYERVLAENDPTKYQMMAMNVLASGSITPAQSFEYVNGLNVQSVVFGASSKGHIQSSVDAINLK